MTPASPPDLVLVPALVLAALGLLCTLAGHWQMRRQRRRFGLLFSAGAGPAYASALHRYAQAIRARRDLRTGHGVSAADVESAARAVAEARRELDRELDRWAA